MRSAGKTFSVSGLHGKLDGDFTLGSKAHTQIDRWGGASAAGGLGLSFSLSKTQKANLAPLIILSNPHFPSKLFHPIPQLPGTMFITPPSTATTSPLT